MPLDRIARLEALLQRIRVRASLLAPGESLSEAELAELAAAERELLAARAEKPTGPRAAASFDALARGDFRQSLLDPSEVDGGARPPVVAPRPKAPAKPPPLPVGRPPVREISAPVESRSRLVEASIEESLELDVGSLGAPMLDDVESPLRGGDLEEHLGAPPVSAPRLLGDPPADAALGARARDALPDESGPEEMALDLGGEFDRDFTGVREVAPLASAEEQDTPISIQAPSMPIGPRVRDAMEAELESQGPPGLYSPDLVPPPEVSLTRERVVDELAPERVEAEVVADAVALSRGESPMAITTFGELLDVTLLL